MSVTKAFDLSGVAVITGGASGFGFVMAQRLVKNGMKVAVLDVSETELNKAKEKLPQILAVKCNVTSFDDCAAAYQAVADGFPGAPTSFLFNNAGISGQEGGEIIQGGAGAAKAWQDIFSVNVFGAVNIIKNFLPGMIAAGPLPSGKKTFIVTTSSVAGLVNHNIGPYSCSKMAATAVCEQLSHELEAMGRAAAHISPRSLHPTVAATNFLSGRNSDGEQADKKGKFIKVFEASGAGVMTTADDIVDGLFKGIDDDKYYIIVDHPSDVPTSQQIQSRLNDVVNGNRPTKPEQLGMILKMTNPDAFAARLNQMGVPVGANKSKL